MKTRLILITLACLLFCGQAWAGGDCDNIKLWFPHRVVTSGVTECSDLQFGTIQELQQWLATNGAWVETHRYVNDGMGFVVVKKRFEGKPPSFKSVTTLPLTYEPLTLTPEEARDSLIRQWAKSGEICRVLGEHWWDYTPAKSYPWTSTERKCRICGKVQRKTERWEEVKP